MKIIIKTKNLKLTEELRNFVEKKIGKSKKFIYVLKEDSNMGKTLAEVFVELEKETNHHRKGDVFSVKAYVNFPGREIIAQAKGDDLTKIILEAADEFQEEIKKYK
jgi:ribosomal subunit interface protein